MAVGQRVKTAGINGAAHFDFWRLPAKNLKLKTQN
jgi:hypothetical protein